MIGILIFIICSAIMDNISSYNTFIVFFKEKYLQTKNPIYQNLDFWFTRDSSNNKYQLKEWLEKYHIPTKLSTFLAKDVLVIFTDAWHFFKSLGIAAIIYPYVIYISLLLNLNFYICYLLLFKLIGIVFNFFFYSFKKLAI